MSTEEVGKYSTDQLITYLQSYLQEKNLTLSDSEIQKFHEENINGYAFLTLTADLLKQCELSIGKRAVLADLINNLNNQGSYFRSIYYSFL
ncbi:hypothetical protein RhiirC2_803493 [Rhizophagus irregularis]|uniref:SAM domain-containing protein n=1 Tax=Rhizophagus irregularis TaxID=588596 RepID=A0A2N1LI18_9GLOM|nr:hypothetical protein RhiirC2_803493 [Rhizophagus irregularis]